METQSSTQNVTGSTPGPWRVEDVGIPGTLAIMAGSTTEYRWIATVTEDMGSGVDWTQTQANARLIAATSRMLDFIRQVALFSNDWALAQTASEIYRDVTGSEPELAP